ncbi:MAG: hypothetical protein LUF92_02570 [Clostridiales bacterium]|nr:hypothetical protein [Clostridiales bacterium]
MRIEREEPTLFLQMVLRAVSENEISVQKGAELLKQPYTFVADQYSFPTTDGKTTIQIPGMM